MIFFTGDHHFGHYNIITYCNRKFLDTHTMNMEMTRRWNEVISKNDIVYHLGDFCFKDSPDKYKKRLNGNIILIKGNHDKNKTLHEFTQHYENFPIKIDKYNCILSHYPVYPLENTLPEKRKLFNLKRNNDFEKYDFVISGHIHNKALWTGSKSLNVGVDMHNFYPISIVDVIKFLYVGPIF